MKKVKENDYFRERAIENIKKIEDPFLLLQIYRFTENLKK